MNSVILALVLGLPASENSPQSETVNAHTALQIQLSGRVDMKYAFRDGTLNEAGENLRLGRSNATGSGASLKPKEFRDNFAFGRITLRLDVDVRDTVKTVIEVENKSTNGYEASNATNYGVHAFGHDTADLDIEQVYLDLDRCMTDRLYIRMGVQDVRYTLRPGGDSFFADLSESESFFEGTHNGGRAVRNSLDRDTLEPVGLRLHYDLWDWLMAELVTVTAIERGNLRNDESLHLLYVNGTDGRNLAFFGLAALTNGNPGRRGDEVWTFGIGLDRFSSDKAWEAFGQVYTQFGELYEDAGLSPGNLDKRRVWAYQVGLRRYADRWWLEVLHEYRSGDNRPTDTQDNAFQSYENVDTLLILEDDEVGLDVDTNYKALKAAVEVGPIELSSQVREIRLRADFGFFKSDEPWFLGTQKYVDGEQNIGSELDTKILWAYDPSTTLSFTLAWLANSEILERLTPSEEESAFATLFGVDVRF